VLASGVTARTERSTTEAQQGCGGTGSPRSGLTPCPDGVLVGRGTGVVDDGHSAA
jgi:hypothetical protein